MGDALESYPADALLLRQSLHQAQLSGWGELGPWRDQHEGDDDMLACIRTALTLQFCDGRLLLGE